MATTRSRHFAAPRRCSTFLAALAAALLLAACGGGGGAAEDPPPADTITVVDGGVVTSTDGKAQLIVPGNSADAGGVGRIVALAPTAEVAADPFYVPDSTYEYSGPAMAFSTPANWELQSAGAVEASSAPGNARGRMRALGATPSSPIDPNRMCDPVYAAQQGKPPRLTTIVSPDEGNACPLNCVQSWSGPWGSPGGGQVLRNCRPNQEQVLVTPPTGCPTGYVDVSTVEPWNAIVGTLNLAFGTHYHLCRVIKISGSPWISAGVLASPHPKHTCVKVNGKFVCKLPSIGARAVYGTYEDKTPPQEAVINLDTPVPAFVKSLAPREFAVYAAAGQTRTIHLTATALDTGASGVGRLGQVELHELVVNTTAPIPIVGTEVLWSAVPATSQLPGGTNFYSSKAQGQTIGFDYTGNSRATERRFFVRAYDTAGNATDSLVYTFKVQPPPAPVIASFTASPSTVAPPGGNVTLAWNITGAATVSIAPGIGAVDPAGGSTVVNVTANTAYTLTATSELGVVTTQVATIALGVDTTDPTVGLASSAGSVVVPDSITLTATAADEVGVAQVEFLRNGAVIATATSAPYSHSVGFTTADIGTVNFTARASDAAGNASTSAPVAVTVAPDTVAPSVTLAASTTAVLAPGPATLTATAADNKGVTRVEFYRGNTLLASDTAAPFVQTVNLTAADVGSPSFSARAFDAADNSTDSNAIAITVTAPGGSDAYASPSGNDAGNTTCAQATPCRTIAKAAQVASGAGSTSTTWLLDGTYTTATQGSAGVALPAGVTLRAANAGLPVLKVPLLPVGNAVLQGLRLGTGGGVTASGGTITMTGIDFVEHRTSAPFVLSGTAALTLNAGGVANYIAGATPPSPNRGVGPLAALTGNATMTVNGGAFDGVEGMGDSGVFSPDPVVRVWDNAQFTMNNVVMKVRPIPVALDVRGAGKLTLSGSTVQRIGTPTAALWGIHVDAAAGTPAQVTLNNSTVTGHQYGGNSAALRVGATGNATVAGNGATLSGASLGLSVLAGGTATLTLTDSAVQNNLFGGIRCDGSCSLAMSGGQVSGNGASGATGFAYFGGLAFLGNVDYTVSLRNVQVVDNRNTVTTGNPAVDTNSGITMVGSAASSWDLGTAASPGGNTFTGNTTGAQTTGVNVKVAAGVTVNAVGNTFIVNTQGTDSAGQYQLGTAPCGPSACVLTSGTGPNFRVTSGSLRLAQ